MPKIYQVFVGCPFAKEIRRNYDRLKRELEAETPLSIVLADTVGVSRVDVEVRRAAKMAEEEANER